MISIEANHQKGRMCDSGDSRHLSATPRALYEYHYQCGLEAMTCWHSIWNVYANSRRQLKSLVTNIVKLIYVCVWVSIATLLVWVNSHFEIWCLSSLASKGYFTYSKELGKWLTINEIHFFFHSSFFFIYIHMQFICSVIFNTFKASKLFYYIYCSKIGLTVKYFGFSANKIISYFGELNS